ncbi:MAG: hypothetical protein Q8S18_12655 [Bacteroidales bacterium]|nr:hypothetical protein [Bacteroidales bacterium]
MKTIRLRFANFMFAFVFIAVSTLFSNGILAQGAEKGFILSITEFTIKSGHDVQFREGVKAWKKCYIENKGEWTWNIWKRMNGEGNAYILTSRMANWAEMDESNDDGKNCQDLVRELINPNIESSENNFARFEPEYSKAYPNSDQVLWVTSWQVNNSTKFTEIVKEISDATKQAEGSSRGYWYSYMGGGKDAADFFVASPFANFAALDVEKESVWTIYEKAKGKEKRDQVQAEFRETIKESWSYLLKRDADLSHNPPSK